MAKRVATAIALALGLLAFSPGALAQLPPAIQADRLQVQADRQVREREYAAALETLDRSLALREEHGLEVPEAFWFQRAEVSMNAGLYAQAVESATRYLEVAGQRGERYRPALELLDRAERLVSIRAPEMVTIPAGSFRMGCVSGLNCMDSELPVHTVTISRPFALSKYEITFDQWDACVADGGCGSHHPSDWGWGRGNRPVVNVSWDDVRAYVSWLARVTGERYRLPSESEWEYAARAGSETQYSWGNEIGSNRANCADWSDFGDGSCGDSFEHTATVGSFAPNAFGLYDMHGNVTEWLEDCWYNTYEGAPSDGSAWLSGDCDSRVLRDGSWSGPPRDLRSAGRGRLPTSFRYRSIGFRVARTLAP